MIKTNSTPKDLADFVFNKLDNIKAAYQKPSNNILQELFENIFYASLKTEEGQFIRVTVTLIDPENPDPSPPEYIRSDRWRYFHFENVIPFTVKNLVKLSKAADVWSSSLAVYYDTNNDLLIWGMIDQAVHYQTYLNHEADIGAEQPGLFQATIAGIGNINVIMDYELIASLKQNVLAGNFIDVFKRGTVYSKIRSISAPYKEKLEAIYKNVIPSGELKNTWDYYIEDLIRNCIIRILLRIQNYQHGGALLITSDVSTDIDIKYKIDYKRLSLAISNLVNHNVLNSNYSDSIFVDFIEKGEVDMPVELYLDEVVSKGDKDNTKDEIKGAVRFIASLSSVDGLVLFNQELEVRGFGVVITVNELPEFIYLCKTAIVTVNKLIQMNPNNFGTRHRSMFSYCWKNEGSLGFVVSQDGDIRAITRVDDKLILWENIRIQRFARSKKLKRKPTKLRGRSL